MCSLVLPLPSFGALRSLRSCVPHLGSRNISRGRTIATKGLVADESEAKVERGMVAAGMRTLIVGGSAVACTPDRNRESRVASRGHARRRVLRD